MVKDILPGLRDDLRSGEHAWRIDALGGGLHSEEADFTDELLVIVPLQEGSRWAKSRRTEQNDRLTGFPLDADMVRRARGEEMKYLVDTLNVWSLASRAVAFGGHGRCQPDPGPLDRHQQRIPRFS